MARVTGIGGIFFRARDPEALSAWYKRHLGIDSAMPPWFQEAGPTVLGLFAQDTDYFGRREQAWMLNLRVEDLDSLLAELRDAGIEITTDPDWDSEIGRFARIHDPEGNPIELWEPAQPAS